LDLERFFANVLSIVQFVGNAKKIVYENISKLFHSNAGWFGNNSGPMKNWLGTFGLVGKRRIY
jgi:hypothetical protein